MAARTYDSSRWRTFRPLVYGTPSTADEVAINYIECKPPHLTKIKAIVLLIHGFPQTSYQFRHVITPLANDGYHVIAPDFRGAGASSKPRNGFDKLTMARDLHALLYEKMKLEVTPPLHIIGHDIGGMIAHAYAIQFAPSTVTWGECPLPGTAAYKQVCEGLQAAWHFHFHWQTDLPELLTAGKEREYIKHFYDRLCYNTAAIKEDDVEHYAKSYRQPGGMRCGFDVYRAFHQDAKDNQAYLQKHGKCKIPCLILNGDQSIADTFAEDQAKEVYENVKVRNVEDSGHWCAEENPSHFVSRVLSFIERYNSMPMRSKEPSAVEKEKS